MSDAAAKERQPEPAPEQPLPRREELVLLVLILADRAWLDDIVTVLLDVGATGATVLDSQGLGAILRREMPIFAGLASLIPERTGSHVILSVVTPEVADAVFTYVEQERRSSERPIVFTSPILRWTGIRL
ncbi:MAG: hypothetical protein D6824_00750 [Planctomycetota bacterium]|nr:MAG: hypothetical protein D6824_00750 [Planctomycetota bacterium]